MTKIRLIPEWLKRLLTTPVAELNRWQYAARFFAEISRQGAHQLREHRASQMAAALAFRTIFGLIPVVVIATLIFRAAGGASLLGDFIDQLLTAAHLDEVSGPEEGVTLAEWARNMVDHLNTNLSVRTIGVIGALVFGWAAIGLLTTIERSFNTICQAPEHRSLARRIPLYWLMITAGPMLLYVSFLLQNRLVTWIQTVGVGDATAGALGAITSFTATWLFLLLLYEFMPHVRVHLGAGAAGSFVAAVFWTVATGAFNAYVGWSFSKESSAFTMLYGTLGLIPVFMFWIYFLWLIVLYGLELTSLLHLVGHRMDGKVPVRRELPPLTDPAGIIPVVQVVATRFKDGLATTADEVVERTGLCAAPVTIMLDALVEHGILHRLDKEGEAAFAVTRPIESITTSDLLAIAQELTATERSEDDKGWSWVRRFHEAQLQLAVHKPLAEL